MIKKTIIASAITFLLAGCDESGSDAPANWGVTSSGDVVVITAMDGYYQNALVFLDRDSDGVLDQDGTDTIFGLTDENGQISIAEESIDTSYIPVVGVPSDTAVPVIVEGNLALQTLVPGSSTQEYVAEYLAENNPDSEVDYSSTYTIDQDFSDQIVSYEIVLQAPISSTIISPITDLITIEVNKGSSKEEAQEAVAESLDMDSDSDLYVDYMIDIRTDDANAILHKQAQILAASKANNTSEGYEDNALEIAEAATIATYEIIGDNSLDVRDVSYIPVIEVAEDVSNELTTTTNYTAHTNETNLSLLQTELDTISATTNEPMTSYTSTLTVTELFSDEDFTNGSVTLTPTVNLQNAENDQLITGGVTLSINDSNQLTIESDSVTAGADITFILVSEDYNSASQKVGDVYAELSVPVSVTAE